MNLLTKNTDVLFPRLWNDFFENEFFGMPVSARQALNVPAVNIRKTESGYTIEVAAPGMKKEDFTISLDNHVLTIASEKKSEQVKEDKHDGYTRREFNFNSFRRSFALPEETQVDKINAHYTDGVLHIEVPKQAPLKAQSSRMIEIA
jgi:HSP20 family protein